MKNIFWAILLIPSILFAVSIYDIQYTEEPGDGTYPSPYEGQTVTTGGIVSATDFLTGQFFITSSIGGAWNGLYIYDNNHQFALGDSLVITGRVYEYNGFTEIFPMYSHQIISSGNPLPEPAFISTHTLHTQEAYESVLVSIANVSVSTDYDQYNNFTVTDGSGICNGYDSFFYYENLPDLLPLLPNYQFEKIVGIVGYQFGQYRLNPRSLSDFYSPENGIIVTNDTFLIPQNEQFTLPLDIHFYGNEFICHSYDFFFHYDYTLLNLADITAENTLSQSGEIFWQLVDDGIAQVSFTGEFSFVNSEILLHFIFESLHPGTTSIHFTDFTINSLPVEWIQSKEIVINPQAEAIGDTITVIQQPLLNIPALITPQQEFEIQCIAPPSTIDWQAELLHGNKQVPVILLDSFYNSAVQRWFLSAIVPEVEIYELYDLRVTASGGIDDTTRQSVSVIPHFKTDFYFAHITDSHLPTRFYYDNEQSLTDSTAMIDLREVIHDLNIIRPEFVLFTGDIVQEGELEDFQNRRYYTKAQRIMRELEVPVFVIAGNHDVGGWPATPPPAGTARRNWWKFFGWNYLENPFAAEPYYTQNYSFYYDDIHFIGMESYVNYDSFMYPIYGNTSFTDEQMNWLQNELTLPGSPKVLFYHYDFSEQINLYDLNADMALWGHIHSNSGNIHQYPYNLSTNSTCDGRRAYRIIQVNDGQLQPRNTISSGAAGTNFTITFEPANDGSAEHVSATIQNYQYIPFSDALVKFIMPVDATHFAVDNGTLLQVDFSEDNPVCYVQVSVPAGSAAQVSCWVTDSFSDNDTIPSVSHFSGYPNPFYSGHGQRSLFSISLALSQSDWGELTVYNVKGQKVKTLYQGAFEEHKKYLFSWNGKNDRNVPVASGVYLFRLSTGGKQIAMKKAMLLK